MNGSSSIEKVFCPYCGCGCRLILESSNDGLVVKPDGQDPVSQGRPCVKGLKINEVLESGRVKTPMIKDQKSGKLRECTWEEAFAAIKGKIDGMQKAYGFEKLRDKIFFIGSGETTNEANYLMSKLCRSYFRSNNIDSCARLCHAATAVGFGRIFGMKAIPKYRVEDLKAADGFLFVGSDPLEDYPVLFNRVIEAKKHGAKVVTVDVAESGTTSQSDVFLKLNPGGILPMISHLVVRLVDGGDISRNAKAISGFTDFVKSARDVSQANPLSSFGFSRDDMDVLYDSVNEAKKLVIGFGMGLTQHMNGVQNVIAITGLSVVMNAILFPNRGKVNVQGAGDVGADPSWRPRKDVELSSNGWSEGFIGHEGKTMTEALYDREIDFVWVMDGNPSHSMPDLNSLDRSLEDKFVIYQHHHVGRTMEFADVVLPSKMITEELGSFTNGERRVRGNFPLGDNRKKTIGGEDGALANAEILMKFSSFLEIEGFDFDSYRSVFEEIIKVVPGYDGLDFEEVLSNEGQFANKNPIFLRLRKYKYDVSHFSGEGDFPYVFTTARDRFQFCSGETSRSSISLRNLSKEPFVYMNPDDAHNVGISDGSLIKIISRAGSITAEVKVNASISKRVLVAPFHYEKLLVNKLTPLDLDPESMTPCYKEVHVRVEKG
ncbi:molybdopterin-dependent oxidoreductase [Candidatus Dojkabacteria bacterium]|nr:molybdopterin-dependent oxidoreductase [Candidatus Dojkabacteria bacterium]